MPNAGGAVSHEAGRDAPPSGPGGGERTGPCMLRAIALWVVLSGFYLLCAGTLSATEFIVGLPAAGAATVFALLVRRFEDGRLNLRAPWLHVVGAPLAALFADAARVGRRLVRALGRRPEGPLGVVVRQPFRPGDDEPEATGRRALVILASSLAPNGYVLRIPPGEPALLMHRLAQVPPDPDEEWPV